MRNVKSFWIEGDVDFVVNEISRLFNQEKVKSRSKAMDNLQSRLFANAQTLITAGYVSFKELLAQIAELEKSVSHRKTADIPLMDKIEAFMQDLRATDVSSSEPLAPRQNIDVEEGEDEMEEEEESEENASNATL